jgi:transposase
MIRGGSGRQRYRVLGAWNAATNARGTIAADQTVHAETMGALLRLKGPVRLVLDNARDQHGVAVMDLATSLDIDARFLPSYSPNLNLLERLWKFTKNKVLYGRHDDTAAAFCGAIDGCLGKIETEHRQELKSLMTHKFQTFDDVSFLAA